MRKLIYRNRWYDTILIPISCAGAYAVAQIMILIIMHFIPILQIFVSTWFINVAINSVSNGKGWETLIFPTALFGIIIIVKNISSIFHNLITQCVGNRIRTIFVEYLTVKCASLPYSSIEDSSVWDMIKRVKTKPDEIVQKGFSCTLNLLGIGIQIVSYLVILYTQVKLAALVIMLVAGFVLAVAARGGENQYSMQHAIAEDVRRYEYYGNVLTDRNYVNERHLFGYFRMFQNKWEEFYQKARNKELKITVKWLIRMKVVSSSMALITFLIALVLLIPISKGDMTIGLYISLIQAAISLVNIMSWELSDNLNEFIKYKGYIKDFNEFSKLEEDGDVLNLPIDNPMIIEKIEFRNVSFKYPHTKTEIFNHFDLKIEKGKQYAIVGKNGAGKSTLIKLLTGLYSEFEGEILLNGIPIQKFSNSEIKAMFSVLFQDFAQYEISMKDNIALGNIRDMDNGMAIRKVVNTLGLNKLVDSRPNGINTLLGKISEDGIDLSGGEWQRIAMARAIISPASVLILDEPTASMDPMVESSLYEEFRKVSRGRTTLFISHRLASTMLADEIIVIDEGKIIQQGSHEKLMEECSIYRDMYESQRSWYVNE